MKKNFCFISLAFLLIACGDVESEQCSDTWWYLEQDGEIVLKGNKASFTNVPGEVYGTPSLTYSQGYFADSDPEFGQGCTFLSKTQLTEGIHDNLTCSIATEQGPNPQWIGAESGSDGDHRPTLTSIKYENGYMIGTFEGTMFRLDTISVSPPNIQGKVIKYKFEFVSVLDDFYDACSDKTCKAVENLSDVADSFISRCRKGSIRREFPSQLLSSTLEEIRKGKTDDHHKAWKLLNDNRFKK